MRHKNWTGALALALLIEGFPLRAATAPDESYPARFFAGFHPSNALDMVEHVPGFTFQPGDATLRGMAEAAGNVVIDGKRIADKNFTLDQVLERIPATQVDHIALIRGSTPGVDMLGQPVVANVVRKAVAGATGALTVSNGTYADGRMIPGLTFERSRSFGPGRSLSFSASLSRYVEAKLGDGSRLRTDDAGRPIERAWIDAASGGVTGFAQGTAELPGLGGQLRFNGTLTWTNYQKHLTDHVFAPAPSVSTLHETLGGLAHGQAGGEISGHLDRKFGDEVDSETSALLRLGRKSYRSQLDAPGAVTLFTEHERSGEALMRSRLHYAASPKLSAALTLEGAYNWLDTRSGVRFNEFTIPLPNGVARVTEARGEIGAEAVWQAANALTAEGGAHVELSRIHAVADTRQARHYIYPKPYLRLTLAPSKRQQVRLRVAREVGQLDFTNFVAAASLDKGSISSGNAAIRPNSAWIAEASYEWHSGGAAVALTARHSWLKDVIDRVPVTPAGGGASFDAPGNIGGGHEDDLIGDLTLPLGGLGVPHAELKLDATWRHARVTDPTTGDKRPISNQKPVEFTANFHQDLPRWRAAWGAKLDTGWKTSTYLFDEVDWNRTSASLTLFADYVPRPNLSFHLEMGQVFGQRYRRVIASYGGLRGADPLAYHDDRRLRLGQVLSLRVRRAF
ncbi:MAG: hypothetical protein JF628_04540 [Sphingomonas sp.]|nr:hypothetical protein [Sphingomonas sp.]